MKCQACHKNATLHITEVMGDGYEEFHFCEECAHRFLNESPAKKEAIKQQVSPSDSGEEIGVINEQRCEVCGMRFVEFRNSGRLGCAHDYQAFLNELAPLLEGIHGQTRHAGKTPRRLPQARQIQQELTQLRKLLQRAVTDEVYEEAARLRDRIRQLETHG